MDTVETLDARINQENKEIYIMNEINETLALIDKALVMRTKDKALQAEYQEKIRTLEHNAQRLRDLESKARKEAVMNGEKFKPNPQITKMEDELKEAIANSPSDDVIAARKNKAGNEIAKHKDEIEYTLRKKLFDCETKLGEELTRIINELHDLYPAHRIINSLTGVDILTPFFRRTGLLDRSSRPNLFETVQKMEKVGPSEISSLRGYLLDVKSIEVNKEQGKEQDDEES
jgi:hypothetical protein